MYLRVFFSFLALMAIVALLGGIKTLQIQKLMASEWAAQAEAIAAAEAKILEWETILPSVGTVKAVQGVLMKAEEEGTVRSIHFEAGSAVEEGALLVKLDTTVEEARLRAAEASAELARLNLERSRDLLNSRTISKSEYDTVVAASKVAEAEAESLKALIAKKQIRAPFSGRLGIREISVGQFLSKGDAVVSLQSFDPIYVEFALPQGDLIHLQPGMETRARGEGIKGELSGKLTAINPDIDRSTRSARLQATFKNPDGALRPGMFVATQAVLPTKRQAVVVPVTAILAASFGDSVYVIKKDPKSEALLAEQAFVRLGESRGDFVEVLEGLNAGDRVATSGVFKLRNGAPVVIRDGSVAAPQLKPSVENS